MTSEKTKTETVDALPANPPRPCLALRLGVTGHRRQRLERSNIEAVSAAIDQVIADFKTAVLATPDSLNCAYSDTPPVLYLTSALATGADTIAAEKALEKGFNILAPLPFARDLYMADFDGEDLKRFQMLSSKARAVIEFEGKRIDDQAKQEAYLECGRATVRYSDVLIAVWDGEIERGRGGTAMIKDIAVDSNTPVIWIKSGEKVEVCLLAQGREIPYEEKTAQILVNHILAHPDSRTPDHERLESGASASSAYDQFLEEGEHRGAWGAYYKFWEALFSGSSPFPIRFRRESYTTAAERDWVSFTPHAIGCGGESVKKLQTVVKPRFAWADNLAIHYGDLYRSSYYFNYLFSALAVFLALIPLVTGTGKTFFISLELAVIGLILWVTLRGRRFRWHEKWIDYRQLAETLRRYRFIYLTGGHLGRAGSEGDEKPDALREGWVQWYFNATVRELGMGAGHFTPDMKRCIINSYLDTELRPQINYHRVKSDRLHKIEHKLHRFGEAAFAATMLVCVSYLGLSFISSVDGQEWAGYALKEIKYLVAMLTGFFPALGAALFGIRVQGEFGSFSERLHITADELEQVEKKLVALADRDEARLTDMQYLVEDASRLMLMENMDWKVLYITKPINLPG